MSEKYRILFSDLDATLLNDNKEIEAGALDAIDALLSQGDFFAICTGRPLASARAVACKAGLERSGCYIVSYNGGVIYDPSRDQIVSYASIPLSVVRRLFEKAQQAGLYIHTYDRTSERTGRLYRTYKAASENRSRRVRADDRRTGKNDCDQ